MSRDENIIYSQDEPFTERLWCGRWVDGDAPGSRRYAIFDMDVLWLRHVGTQYLLYWDGKLLDEGSSWVALAGIKAGQERAESLRLTDADRLEVRVVAKVTDQAVRPLPRESYERGPTRRYLRMDQVTLGTPEELARVASFDWNADLPEGAWTPFALGDTDDREVAEAVVWSSKWTPDHNAAVLAEFTAEYGTKGLPQTVQEGRTHDAH